MVLQLDRDAIVRWANLSTGVVKTAIDQLFERDMIALMKRVKAFSQAVRAAK